ncbi:APC family permease [Marinitenerispora sediminis]|uniref:Amino acid transporter n=1 Tax=Marinitenerispora sediminis TaxID=1931232 RepID=A0A368T3D2_9ACTN|nr:amino acid transporter [Marinitenerispora sediminis]RCV48192.1 amino acid transporter [Marinitenerispora sediminis]RCV49243.1 amino acid transporter [Marinitenerispora sediminis]RCV51699.1 amino acid transporter [Marinitenerispora sediminis]
MAKGGTLAQHRPLPSTVRRWLLDGLHHDDRRRAGPHGSGDPRGQHRWWQVMCLTGVDYFSTLGYQPGIAFVAAGLLSPVATLVLVAVTLLGALPIYRWVAGASPHGQGSLAMLERLLPWWGGKMLVLVLLGFVATDFVITMTLSAADATAHVLENPYVPHALDGHHVGVTLAFLALLGVVFLAGFSEAVGIAVVIVGCYLAVNVVVIAAAVAHVLANPHVVVGWEQALFTQHGGDPLLVIGLALIVFPKLALGLSGFETGVTLMPQVRGGPGDTPRRPAVRIRRTRRMLTTAALIMSVLLITSSLTTTLLIPAREFEPGGAASGRALAYLAHAYLGNGFGTVYDAATIAILWFAGASAMAGLLNIVPRYLPRYGMAPDWTRAVRPLVFVFTGTAFLITLIFDASVEAQGGAYATGVLVLMLSAAFAVTLSARRARRYRAAAAFAAITLVFGYTTVANIIERPDGVKIASCFILAIVATSLVSRATRSTELRVTEVQLDRAARRYIHDTPRPLRFVAHEPGRRAHAPYRVKERETRELNHLPPDVPLLFLEVTVSDASEFATVLKVTGEECYGYRVLRLRGPSVPNGIAAFLLHVRDITGDVPHVYFSWAEGNPVMAMLTYLVFGGGDVAPLTREVVREAEPHPARRPLVHVG